MSIIGFLIFGLVIGLIARAIFPGRQQMGWLSTAVLAAGRSDGRRRSVARPSSLAGLPFFAR